jgi:glyoxylase-like metal-dependent hydrolase (beta-lactamase superfamily II)/anti-anti-sigma regulatory factor
VREQAANTVSYVAHDPQSSEAAIIDSVLDFEAASGRTSPGSADLIVEYTDAKNLKVKWLIDTHAHTDHISAAPYLQERVGGKLAIGKDIIRVQEVFGKLFNAGTEFERDGSQFDHLFEDGETFALGKLEGIALHVPGHTPADMAFIIGDAAFVGDTIFIPDFGTARADFPGGDADQPRQDPRHAALLISIIGFVESVSVARTLAAKRRQRISPDQELVGLGAANIASAFSGGSPVTGGFARSAVNFDAGAETPAAGAFTAVGIALASLFLTPLLYSLPVATLAATIIVAVLSLVDLKTPGQLWRYSKADFAAHVATIGITLLAGVEMGVIAGVGVRLLLYLWSASRPHAAIVGRGPETEHFRNIERHAVFTDPHILSIRIDESLTYLNAHGLEVFVMEEIADHPELRHVILMCSAVNAIDASGLESLEAINHRLKDGGFKLHLSEAKGPVMDKLERTHFVEDLGGKVHLSQAGAFVDALRDNGDSDLQPHDLVREQI